MTLVLLASTCWMQADNGGSRWTAGLLHVAHLPVPSSSTCRQTRPILPLWSPIVCFQMCWSSEVTKVSSTNQRSSSSNPHNLCRAVCWFESNCHTLASQSNHTHIILRPPSPGVHADAATAIHPAVAGRSGAREQHSGKR